jgi:hypothetical protein
VNPTIDRIRVRCVDENEAPGCPQERFSQAPWASGTPESKPPQKPTPSPQLTSLPLALSLNSRSHRGCPTQGLQPSTSTTTTTTTRTKNCHPCRRSEMSPI